MRKEKTTNEKLDKQKELSEMQKELERYLEDCRKEFYTQYMELCLEHGMYLIPQGTFSFVDNQVSDFRTGLSVQQMTDQLKEQLQRNLSELKSDNKES